MSLIYTARIGGPLKTCKKILEPTPSTNNPPQPQKPRRAAQRRPPALRHVYSLARGPARSGGGISACVNWGLSNIQSYWNFDAGNSKVSRADERFVGFPWRYIWRV